MNKEDGSLVRITMEYYLAIKRNVLESVLVRWMNLEPVIQSEVKLERENQVTYRHIHMEHRKTVLMNPSAGQEQRCRHRDRLWTLQGKERVGITKSSIGTFTSPYVNQIASGNLLCKTGSSTGYSAASSDGGWGVVSEGGDTCLLMADSRCCTAEANTIL